MSASRPSTVRQLLHSAKLGGAKVLGGEAGLDQVVTDVRLSATVTRTEVLPAGTLVILDGATLDDNAYVIDHALRILSEAGGAGLILADPRRHPDLGPARLANQFRVPFIVVEGVPAMELAHSLRATYWAAEVEQAAVIDRLLSDVSLMRHRDVDSFIVAIASIAHVPFSLIDRNRHPIVGTHISTSGRRLAETVGHLVDYGGDGALHSAPIVLASGEPVSYWLIAESKGPDAAYGVIRAVVQLGAWYLTSLLASARMRHEREARRRIAVLNELLDAGDRPELDLRNQLADMGWTVTGWNMGLHIKLGGSVDPGRVVDLHAEISQRLDAEGVRGPVVERTDGWSGWTTFAEEPFSRNVFRCDRRDDRCARRSGGGSSWADRPRWYRPPAYRRRRASQVASRSPRSVPNSCGPNPWNFGCGPHRSTRCATGPDGVVRLGRVQAFCSCDA